MAGLLAWAADVVGKNGKDGSDEKNRIPLVFTEEQQKYVDELGRKAATLSRSIQDLRLRLPPPDISQRLPHLHAHSLASNAALTLQLDSHSATREQAQVREQTLLEASLDVEEILKAEQEASLDERHSKGSGESFIQPDGNGIDGAGTEAMKSVMLQKLESLKESFFTVFLC
ncbi:hypothetical protein F2Q68_00022689 [Brassica cretica]|uniref:Uncharacterized protein n=1 Tax=Brassica cretica TaxID=69181 RepID=A0A8S9G204_BRACR|nr:hypothetical protein F2Q68_00022689 [Brassica cretica]